MLIKGLSAKKPFIIEVTPEDSFGDLWRAEIKLL